ncbi:MULTISPECIES: 50S ribosomal protein L6 [unclassified Sedimentibacter]|uniref:50S ribosomal protein L6 n=1 Tax=unclassified Sedimentibacter TaxID=2649220 RepID=UPI0027E18D8B|nr:50S ribosomal protein L6 [Sedimentibacter sp. MB35-C1]WMJ76607.1 50S ribosomal protein L6 [Sedimentibacter sp. MB35-C1]
MSRIGIKPVNIPANVEVSIDKNNYAVVKGPKGQIEQQLPKEITIEVEGSIINVSRPNDEKRNRSLHGLTRTLVNNMVVGVTDGFSKSLEIVGVGYRAQKQGNKLVLNLGFSHPVEMEDPNGIETAVEGTNKIIVKGIDKQQVGNYAAVIRDWRRPEPYKGKGIKYSNEVVRRKAGKTGK